ncbi:NUDIX domain-containing protein [Paenibacillus arenilitoris]|uniref:NUDIX hydrolase n=1 Tax=Paenibacillus arenilitoris TaxID=2772299 RepID=A0A927H6K1_9BACL|nr:NUDIX hydrolase [Paenibacillus arenilitoris]MBD2870646.1 NUDIX hydrolase [Paenibacillus arenilitoris]
MRENVWQAAAGGIYFEHGRVLLVRIDYGRNKGMWMLPGGFVEAGESIEEAAEREFKEETGLAASAGRLAGVRTGVQASGDGGTLSSVYFVFEMQNVSGTPARDEREISELRFWPLEEVEASDAVVELSNQMITRAASTANGLFRGTPIRTKNAYKSYSYYVPNG